jgi:hypothetical protein
MTYKIFTHTTPEGIERQMVIHFPSGEQFSPSDTNIACQQYLAWLEEGNEPEPWEAP